MRSFKFVVAEVTVVDSVVTGSLVVVGESVVVLVVDMGRAVVGNVVVGNSVVVIVEKLAFSVVVVLSVADDSVSSER